MSDILFINACPREHSRTRELAGCLLEKLSGTVEEVSVYDARLQPLDRNALEARERAIRDRDPSHGSLRWAKQFADARCIVIAAPYWDLMFPAALKTYLENVCVAGLTFRYSPQGIPEGLCRAGALYYVTTAGGYIGENDFGFAYVKALARTLFGIGKVEGFCAQGLDISAELARSAMEAAKARIALAAERRDPEN